jgi:hypothetical protein
MYETTQYIGIVILGFFIWLCFEFWRAPMMDENTGRILKPGKKLSDLFKKKKKSGGSYKDLEKFGRGRSKH